MCTARVAPAARPSNCTLTSLFCTDFSVRPVRCLKSLVSTGSCRAREGARLAGLTHAAAVGTVRGPRARRVRRPALTHLPRGTRLEALDRHDLERGRQEALDVAEERLLGAGHQRHGPSGQARAAGPANAMNVI